MWCRGREVIIINENDLVHCTFSIEREIIKFSFKTLKIDNLNKQVNLIAV